MRATIALTSLFLLGACAGAAPPDEPGSDSLSDHLSQGVAIHSYAGGTLAVTGRLTSAGAADQVGRATLSIVDASGWVQFDPDGVLWLENLQVELDDVVVWFYRTPVQLTDLRLSLAERTGAFPSAADPDTGRIELLVPVSFDLSWAVRESDGGVRPLPAGHTTSLPMVVSFELNPLGLLVGHVRITGEGEVWGWRDNLHLEDPDATFDVTDHPAAHPVE